ncbi:orotidine-5'-phosphate decarboxylase [Bacillota bacterium]
MMDHLIEKIELTENPAVVGLDPTLDMIPPALKKAAFEKHGKTPEGVAAMLTCFNKAVIDAVGDLLPAVKPQIAMYERYGLPGLSSYIETIEYAKSKGLIVIGDIKRGDIASTAEAYAAHVGGTVIEGELFDCWKEDAVTVNPYFGTDGIAPFAENCKKYNKGIFILIRTSNKSSHEIQELPVKIGDSFKPLCCHVADLVNDWGKNMIGKRGYSLIGAVVGATHKDQGAALRAQLPNTFFLVPGYGAQGGTGADLKGYFAKDGLGIIVNSSRGITGAWQKDKDMAEDPELGTEFAEASRKAVIAMREDLRLAMEG